MFFITAIGKNITDSSAPIFKLVLSKPCLIKVNYS